MNQLHTYLALVKRVSRQDQRYPQALEPNYACVDDKSLIDLLAYCKELAGCFHFINEDLIQQGRWDELFSGSELSLLAELAHFAQFHAKNDLLFSAQQVDSAEKNTYLSAKVKQIILFSFQLDKSIAALNQLLDDTAIEISTLLSKTIKYRLRFELKKLLSQTDASILHHDDMTMVSGLSSLWQLNSSFINDIKQNQSMPNLSFTQVKAENSQVDQVYYAFTGEFASIHHSCLSHFETLLSKQQHDPTIAMLITFLQLYRKVQVKINEFAAKHLSFYYFDILKVKPAKEALPRAFLTVEPLGLNVTTSIHPNTIFTALNDSKLPQEYTPEGFFALHTAKISTVLNVNLQRDQLISPEFLFGHCNQISVIERLSPTHKHPEYPWPLFGDKQGFVDVFTNKQAEIGFALAAPDFFLKEGKRKVDIAINLQHASNNSNIANFLYAANAAFNEPTLQESNDVATSLQKCFEDFEQVFNLRFAVSAEHLVGVIPNQDIVTFFKCSIEEQIENCLFFYLLQRLNYHALSEQHTQNAMYEEDMLKNKAQILGIIFSRQLFSNSAWLNNEQLNQLELALKNQAKAPAILESDHKVIMKVIRGQDQYRHSALVSQLFSLRVTTAQGWRGDIPLSVSLRSEHGAKARLHISLEIDASVEAIVAYDKALHKAKYSTSLPVFEFRLNNQADYFGYSVLANHRALDAEIKVNVTHINSAFVRNQIGVLDVNNTATLFGAKPNQYSFCQIAYFEAARKNVSQYEVQVQYTELPKRKGGFADHYQAYAGDYSNEVFKLDLQVYANGQFKTLDSVKMFSSKNDRLLKQSTYHFSNEEGFNSIQPYINEQQFLSARDAQNGYLRLAFAEPSYGFGHDIYPTLLASTLIDNNRRKLRKQQPIPNAPYTPKIDKISLSYQTNSCYDFLKNDEQKDKDTNIENKQAQAVLFHFSQLETCQAKATSNNKRPDLLPKITQDANLLLGISSEQQPKQLSIFFDLQDNCEIDISRPRPSLLIKVFTEDGWQALPANNILFDGTANLTTSGVITLSLPVNFAINQSAHYENQYWINISISDQANLFSGCKQLQLNVVSVVAKTSQEKLSSNAIWSSNLASIKQVGLVKEQVSKTHKKSTRDLITATSERLRHKNRPVTALDFEQFILERFPDICMAKCFAHTNKDSVSYRQNKIGFKPGHLLIIVVPFPKKDETICDAVGASSTVLQEIYDAVREVAPMFANIHVSNPLYERVQVRCSVKFNDSNNAGVLSQRLNQQISQYFDVFSEHRVNQTFGWQLSCEELFAYIQTLPIINHVTNFSILHISQRSKIHYHLYDSVSMKTHKKQIIQSKYPWCLALPDKQHWIELITDKMYEEPNVTGINEMKIGNNFILGGK